MTLGNKLTFWFLTCAGIYILTMAVRMGIAVAEGKVL